MQPVLQRFDVRFSYPVHFTSDLFSPEQDLLARTISSGGEPRTRKVLFVLDSGVAEAQPELAKRIASYASAFPADIHLAGAPVIVPGGEVAKNDPAVVETIHRAVHERAIDRHSYVVAVGGGAVLDAVGYAAATAHRGIRLIRVPTTVLSQNDSAVGVKNSVNAFGKKNFLGTFAPPFAVLNDFEFLETLHDRDWRSGISEAVKVALIKDAAFFNFIESAAPALARREMEPMQYLIYRCAELHLQHIATSGDPFETGSSRPLDFGHWAAHKLEQLTGYELRHGEAVAIGIALDCAYAHLEGRLTEASLERVLDTLEAVGFRLFAPELAEHLHDPAHPRSVLRGLQEFREHLGGELTIMLLDDIGRGAEVHSVSHALFASAVNLLRERAEVPAA